MIKNLICNNCHYDAWADQGDPCIHCRVGLLTVPVPNNPPYEASRCMECGTIGRKGFVCQSCNSPGGL